MILRALIAIAWLFAAMPAFAAGWESFEATTTAAVEIRGAPGPYDPIASIPAQTNVIVGTCFKQGAWCAVHRGAISGYADATLLKVDGETVKTRYERYWEALVASAKENRPASKSRELAIYGDSTGRGDGGTPQNRWYELLAQSHPFSSVHNVAISGQSIMDMAKGYESDTRHRDWLTIIYDRKNGDTTPDEYLAALDEVVGEIETDRFLILPQVMTATQPEDERDWFIAINEEIRKRWPENTFSQETEASFLAALSNPDTRADDLHRNNAGQRVEYRFISDWLSKKGW